MKIVENAEWIDCDLAAESVYGVDGKPTESFSSLGLNKAGTLIELADGSQHLIGDCNTDFGTCGCCGVISSNNRIKRYKVIFEK